MFWIKITVFVAINAAEDVLGSPLRDVTTKNVETRSRTAATCSAGFAEMLHGL